MFAKTSSRVVNYRQAERARIPSLFRQSFTSVFLPPAKGGGRFYKNYLAPRQLDSSTVLETISFPPPRILLAEILLPRGKRKRPSVATIHTAEKSRNSRSFAFVVNSPGIDRSRSSKKRNCHEIKEKSPASSREFVSRLSSIFARKSRNFRVSR